MQSIVEQQDVGKTQQIHRLAGDLYHKNPDWVTFFRELLGVEGAARQYFSTNQEWSAFKQTDEYTEIQQMVAKLRERGNGKAERREPTRVITVRLPKSLHESLRAEAHDQHTSMNKLCISKLLQVIDGELIPQD